MPVVRTYGPRQVSSNPLPGARLTPVDTPEAEGAGLAEAQGQAAAIRGRAAEQVDTAAGNLAAMGAAFGEREFARIQQQARQDANETARLKWTNQLADWSTKALYDPQTGALNRRGESAFSLPEDVGGAFETMADDIGNSLVTPEQKLAFAKDRAQVRQTLNLQVVRHVDNEMHAFKQNELKGVVANSIDDAIRNAQDPHLVGQNLAKAEDAIRRNAPALGLGPAVIDEQLRAVRTNTHAGVISQLLALDQPTQAKAYFDAMKDEIAADRLDTLEKALEEGGLRAQSQVTADRIAAAGGTLTEQLEKAKGLDPKLRDLVEQRLEHNAAIVERATRENEEATLKRAYTLVDKSGGDVTKIPAEDWASFSGAHRSALRSYAEHLARGTQPETDDATYYALMSQAVGAPGYGTSNDFAQQNLLAYRAKLDDADFKHLVGLQQSIRSNQMAAAQKPLDDFRTTKGVIDQALTKAGIDPDPKKDDTDGRQRVARFYSQVAEEQRRVEQITNRKLSDADLEQIANRLLARQITVHGWFSDTVKRLEAATIDDVPRGDRKQIEDSLRYYGQPVDDATVLDVWIAHKRKGGSVPNSPKPSAATTPSAVGEAAMRVAGKGMMGLGHAIDWYEQQNRKYPIPYTNWP